MIDTTSSNTNTVKPNKANNAPSNPVDTCNTTQKVYIKAPTDRSRSQINVDGFQYMHTDVTNLSSNRLGYIIRMSTITNVAVDKQIIDQVRNELIRRGDYEAEINRRPPH